MFYPHLYGYWRADDIPPLQNGEGHNLRITHYELRIKGKVSTTMTILDQLAEHAKERVAAAKKIHSLTR